MHRSRSGAGGDRRGRFFRPRIAAELSTGSEPFMRKNKYPKAGNWCGKFAASVYVANGLQPPQNPEIASNWRRTPGHKLVQGPPQPGDIAVRIAGKRGRIPTGWKSLRLLNEVLIPRPGSSRALARGQASSKSVAST